MSADALHVKIVKNAECAEVPKKAVFREKKQFAGFTRVTPSDTHYHIQGPVGPNRYGECHGTLRGLRIHG